MLGFVLKKLRDEKGLTQKEISEIVGIAQTTYAGYEKNKHEPDLATLIRIADYYRVSLDYITGRMFMKN